LTLLRDYLKFKQAPALTITPAFKNHIFWEAYFFSRLEITLMSALRVAFAMLKVLLARKWVQFRHRKALFQLKMKEG
jgi:hypothetical protein